MPLQALIFDCDGVLVDTERDGHRAAFNETFRQLGWPTTWTVERYAELLTTAGGKERTVRHFNETGWPMPEAEREAAIAKSHKMKTDVFMKLIESGRLPLRPGVARIIDEAKAAGVKIAVCSTSNERAVQAVVDTMLGAERSKHITVFAGDAVAKKKPDPAIYLLAIGALKLEPSRCVVIEDSNNGLRAANAAGLKCLVTVSSYTGEEDFALAARVVPDLGDPPGPIIGLGDLVALLD